MIAHEPFEAPYNWCDNQCQRCALRSHCQVALLRARRRWRREARGEDPDTSAAVLDDVQADLQDAYALLQQSGKDDGIDLSAPQPPRPIALNTERLKRATLRLARRIVCIEVSGEAEQAWGAECAALCFQLAGKTARVTCYVTHGDAEIWPGDAVPNLMLIELTLARLRQTVGQLGGPRTTATLDTLAELERLLSPLLATIDNAARAQLTNLVRSGRAPSPFLIAAPEHS